MDNLASDQILISLGLIIVAGIAAQYAAWRLKMPSIVLLTVLGFLLGPIAHWVDPHEVFGKTLHAFIELAVAIILFEGGLNLRLHEFRKVSVGIRRLISLGLLFNFAIGSFAAYYFGNFSLDISLLIGGILVVTGPTVIIPILRHSKLESKIKSYLKWEGIINDPLGVLLVALIYQFVISTQSDINLITIVIAMVKAITISALIAFLIGFILKLLFTRSLMPDYLKVPSTLAMVVASFLLARYMQDGAGLLAATFLGMYFGNSSLAIINDLRRFKESVSIILVSVIFILLSASIEIKSITLLEKPQILFIILATFAVRPIAVFISTIKSQMNLKERLLIGYFGPKGIVAASVAGIFGIRLSDMGYENAELILPVVFMVVCSTVLIHSISLEPLGKALGLSIKTNKGLVIAGASKWSVSLASCLEDLKIPVLISDINWKRLKKARDLGLKTHFGQILLDTEEGTLDLNQYEYLFAATNNDSYNALVCQRLAEDFDRDNVYQLALHEERSQPDELPVTLRGHVLKNPDLIYEVLRDKTNKGWSFKATLITEVYSYKNFLADHSEGIPLMIIKKNQQIFFFSKDKDHTVVTGDMIVSFQP